jgi:hypothetical protein
MSEFGFLDKRNVNVFADNFEESVEALKPLGAFDKKIAHVYNHKSIKKYMSQKP